MFVDIDFIRRVFPRAHSRGIGYFGWAVTMTDETNTLASQATDPDLSNDILAVIRSADGATTLSWEHLSAETNQDTQSLYDWNFDGVVLSRDPDAIVIEGSSFTDGRLDRFIFNGILSGYACVLVGTKAEYASPEGKRLLDLMETIRKFEEDDVWWGDGFIKKLEHQAREFIAPA